jgi:hypothetical protein
MIGILLYLCLHEDDNRSARCFGPTSQAAAALREGKFRDLIEEGLRYVLASQTATPPADRSPQPTVDDLMQDCRGIVADAPADYATNPKYIENFGR